MQFAPDLLRQCWFLAGPTACGKTAAGLALAEALNAEIVSLDSMAVYRGMDIGTAKPTPAERERVPHHLLDVVEPHVDFSLAEYVEAAHAACADIVSRGRTPLFVGGTGLYLRGVLRGVFDGPPADWAFREELQTAAAGQADDWLHRRLATVDAEAASRLHPRDARRLIRALEVIHVTGRRLSDQQRQVPLPVDERPLHVYWLEPPRKWLYKRIDARVEKMIAEGLIDEVRRLLRGTAEDGSAESTKQTADDLIGRSSLSRTARQALGYREVIDFLAGKYSQREMIETIQTRTRQFAKRQHTWFRNLEECDRIPISGGESAERIAEILAAS